MAKFIIEVSDGYIRERADIENIKSKSETTNFAKMMMEFLSFSGVESMINAGKNEFHISSQDIGDDEKKREMFNDVMIHISALALVMNRDKKDNE